MYLLRDSIMRGQRHYAAAYRELAPSTFRVVGSDSASRDVAEADEVLICNALMPLVPVRRWEETTWSSRELYHFLAPLCELSG